jgi:hypothetical protein
MLMQSITRNDSSLLENLPNTKQKSSHGPNNLVANPQTLSQLTAHSSPDFSNLFASRRSFVVSNLGINLLL